MDPEQFASFLDASWQGMRQQLLDAYPLLTAASPAGRHSTSASSIAGFQSSVDSSLGLASLDGFPPVPSGLPTLPQSIRPRNTSVKSLKSITTSDYAATIPDGEASVATHTFHGDSESLLGSGLKDLSKEEAQKIRNRLRLRLGALSGKTLVTGRSLLDIVSSLGLTTYAEQDMNDMINRLADFIGLWFEPEPNQSKRSSRPSASLDTLAKLVSAEDPRNLGRPRWQWPGADHVGNQHSLRRGVTSSMPFTDTQPICSFNAVPAQALIDVFFSDEEEMVKRIFGPKLMNQFRAIQEIMLAGDTNRLVAELTFVRINDLAAPPEPTHPLMYIEPVVALLIIANGVMIGLQVDPVHQDWQGWTYVEAAFQCVLLLEIFLRMGLLGCHNYWCGVDVYWNLFDLFLFTSGFIDVLLQLTGGLDANMEATSLLRVCRLIRLVRIVKIFRIRFMRDLRLMVKGLIAGVKTLALAFVLLFAVLYVISGFAAMTIGSHPKTEEIQLTSYFKTIPDAMFTCFRCFTGECATDAGEPIQYLLAREFGYIFMFIYVGCYMLVAMGIFNVILAVYVDITMKAAKENDALNAEQYSRESIRIARTTRELVKKFASAYKIFNDMEEQIRESTQVPRLALGKTLLFTESESEMDKIAITKELFLLIIQDAGVQRLMDDLDLPPDRANLFEIIDADGSGTLQITELLHGLLKIRGDLNKSDAVASLLATRAVQHMLSDFITEHKRSWEGLCSELSGLRLPQGSRRTSQASLASSSISWSGKALQQKIAARQGPVQAPSPVPVAVPAAESELGPRKQMRKTTVTFESPQESTASRETPPMSLELASPTKPSASEQDGALPNWSPSQ